MSFRVERLAEGVSCYLGDCREVVSTLDKADAVLTDPPYGIGIASNPVRQKHEKKDWDARPVDGELLRNILSHCKEAIVWGGNYFGLPASQCFLVWDKKQ